MTTDALFSSDDGLFHRDLRLVNDREKKRRRYSGGAATAGFMPDLRFYCSMCRRTTPVMPITSTCSAACRRDPALSGCERFVACGYV